MFRPSDVVLLPDAGPLITLAYADALDLLFVPGWSLALVDRVLEEVTRNQTPTSRKPRAWVLSLRLYRQIFSEKFASDLADSSPVVAEACES